MQLLVPIDLNFEGEMVEIEGRGETERDWNSCILLNFKKKAS